MPVMQCRIHVLYHEAQVSYKNAFLSDHLSNGLPYAIGLLSVCPFVSYIAILVLKRDVKLPTN